MSKLNRYLVHVIVPVRVEANDPDGAIDTAFEQLIAKGVPQKILDDECMSDANDVYLDE